MLKFNDGVEFDLSGEPRIEERYDGKYVVGNNMLIPVNDLEAEEVYKRELERFKNDKS